jgi:hypothetical protein
MAPGSARKRVDLAALSQAENFLPFREARDRGSCYSLFSPLALETNAIASARFQRGLEYLNAKACKRQPKRSASNHLFRGSSDQYKDGRCKNGDALNPR